MILYHGSTLEVQQPRILKSEIGRDFGFAFYKHSLSPFPFRPRLPRH